MRRVNIPLIYYGFFALIALVYISTVFLFKSDPAALARYQVSDMQLKLIALALILPIVLIWFAGFFGFVNLQKYAQKIKGSRDGKGFALLAAGVTVFGVTVVINSVLARILHYAAQQDTIPDIIPTLFDMEFATLANLASFLLIFLGAKKLVSTLKNGVKVSHIRLVSLAWVVVCVPYVAATFLDPSHGLGKIGGLKSEHGIPYWLVVVLVVVPYILTWGLGLFATLFLYTYNKNVNGSIYKKALSRLTKGFFIILIITIVLQFLYAASSMLASWGLSAILSLLYVLLLVITIGFLYIARGAKNLSKLEDVT